MFIQKYDIMDLRLISLDILNKLLIRDYNKKLNKDSRKPEREVRVHDYFMECSLICKRKNDRCQNISIIHPSDGHPQLEHCPDFTWFRPLTHNNFIWVLYWPELHI